jgi:hypothetical protein
MVLKGKRWKKGVRFDSLGITTLMMDENLTMLGENMIKLYIKCWRTKNEFLNGF